MSTDDARRSLAIRAIRCCLGGPSTQRKKVVYRRKKLKPNQEPDPPKIDRVILRIEMLQNNNKAILHWTGVQTYDMVRYIFQYVLKDEEGPCGTVHYQKLKGAPRKKHILTPLNEMFLTLVRLRRGLDFKTIALLFGVSTSVASKIFNAWINLLYLKLSTLDFFPPRDILISKATPTFLKKYPNVIGSIDCTEFQIQTPSSMLRQSQCFSSYKNYPTLKALIMVNPQGAIVFVSNLFTGSISDQKIVEESGFLWLLKHKLENNHLNKGDIILADKGFKIEELLSNIGIELNIPTFRITGMQFSPNDVELIRRIAHERVHVERAIRRIKAFRFLANVIPIGACANINQIFTVCAILTSFLPPLIREK